ncbi:hypothetical protein EN45_087650 [Penicillium chrysogenum]|uniref:Uncharacterized protein n=1 Tax=Penicillium chrysogenum TaxID=5076 RepID=A0A167QDB3_PENCH|nr:hypothetical protein EN45_087650 [Penicillium chrysogenum]
MCPCASDASEPPTERGDSGVRTQRPQQAKKGIFVHGQLSPILSDVAFYSTTIEATTKPRHSPQKLPKAVKETRTCYGPGGLQQAHVGDKSQIGTVRHAQALLATPRKHRGRKTPGPLTLFRYSILIVPSHDTTPSAFQLYFTFASLSQIIPTKPRATKTIIHLNMPRSKFISLRPA